MVVSKLLDTFGLFLTERSKIKLMAKQSKGFYSHPFSPIDLTKFNSVDWADIIHLHWINFYVDYPSFFAKVKKPIVWTIHDENLFCGAAHYTRDVLKENNTELRYQKLKQQVIGPLKNINIVFLSEFMRKEFQNHPIVVNKHQVVINNSVDTSKFCIYDKASMRCKYNIDSSKIVFAFLAYEIFTPRKGLLTLVHTLQRFKSKDILVLAIGGNTSKEVVPEMVRCFGRIDNPDILSQILSCADYFAMPSYQEAFAQSPIEAMACGLPVVAFPCSGTQELINKSNGIVCSDFTENALFDGIKELMSYEYNKEAIRTDVTNRFSPHAIAMKYKKLYITSLQRSNSID